MISRQAGEEGGAGGRDVINEPLWRGRDSGGSKAGRDGGGMT